MQRKEKQRSPSVLLGIAVLGLSLLAVLYLIGFIVYVDMRVSVPGYSPVRPTHVMVTITDKKQDFRFKYVLLREGRCRLIFFRRRPCTYYLLSPAFSCKLPGEKKPYLLAGEGFQLYQDGECNFRVPPFTPVIKLTLKPKASIGQQKRSPVFLPAPHSDAQSSIPLSAQNEP